MSHIHDFLQAHLQTWQSRHFEKTKAGCSLTRYKNLHKGESCFILGNGPSLRAEDLTKIDEAGIVTFGTNRIYNIFSDTCWRPTYYVCEDELILKGKEREIEEIPAKAKFIPAELRWYHGVNVKDADYYHIVYNAESINPWSFSPDIAKGIGCGGTVTFACMQIAAYMGFANIYLLGVDHNYQVIIDIDGNVVTDPTAGDYFCEQYDEDIKNTAIHDMGQNTRAYLGAKGYLKAHPGSTIYNATRGGKLEVFERVDFDELIFQLRERQNSRES